MDDDYVALELAFRSFIQLIQTGNIEGLSAYADNNLLFDQGVIAYAMKLYERNMVVPSGQTIH